MRSRRFSHRSFIRAGDGGIIPLLAGNRLHAPVAGEAVDLELRHYGSAAGTFSLYDDGTTFGYERGDTPAPAVGKPFSYRTLTWTMMTVP